MKSITEEIVQKKLNEMLDPAEEFVVSLSISSANDIVVVLDSLSAFRIHSAMNISLPNIKGILS